MRNAAVSAAVVILVGVSTIVVVAPRRGTSVSKTPVDAARDGSGVPVLQPFHTIEGRLGRREVHRYRIALAADDYVRLAIEQRGADVVARTRDAAGNTLAEFDDEVRPRGEEEVELVADTAGEYTVTIEGAHAAAAGAYTIQLAAQWPATLRDRARQEARSLRTAAARLEAE